MATIRELRAKFTASAQGFKQTITDMNSEIKKVGEGSQKSTDQANKGFSNLKTTLMGFAGAYLGFEAIKGVVGGVISVVDDYQTSLNGLQAQTGATDEEMKGMSNSLKDIYAGGYGADFKDIADSMSLVKNATGLTGKELDSATKKAILLRDQMGLDMVSSTKTADIMMKQFGITSDQAFELMAQGQQSGLNKSEDMLDSFDEYSVYFKQLGFDAEGMWNVYDRGIKAGVRNTDLIGDSIKEFGIRAIDGSKGTSEAFQGLGLDANKMAQEIAKGGPSSQKALEQTFQALGKIEDPVKRNALGVALFGTQFEDMGLKAIQALGQTSDKANMTGDAMKKLDQLSFNSLGSAFEYVKRQIIVGLLEPIEKNVMPKLNTFLNFIKSNMPQIKSAVSSAFSGLGSIISALAPTFINLFNILKNVGAVVIPILIGAFAGIMAVITPLANGITGIVSAFTGWSGFGPVVIGLATALGVLLGIQKASLIWTNLVTNAIKLWTVAQRLLNIAMAMNPIGIIVALLVGLVAGLIYAYQTSETFRNIVNGAWNGIKTIVSAVISWFKTTIPQWINGIKTGLSALGSFMSGLWNGIKSVAIAIWNGIKTGVMAVINAWLTVAKAVFNVYKTAVLFIFNALKTGAIAVWNALKTGVMAVINGLVNTAKAIFNAYKTGVLIIFNALKTGALAVWNALKSGVINIVNSIKSGVTNAFNTAKTMAINSWNALKSGVQNAINGVIGFVTGMKSKITSIISGINLVSIGKNIIQGLINGIKSMVGAVGDAIKSVASNITGKIKGALGIHSPSRVFMEIGQFTGEGLAIGIDNMKKMVADATGGLADASIGTINDTQLNPITTTVDTPPSPGQGGQGGTNYNAPLMNIENYYQNDQTDVRSISNGLYNLQRNSDRKKGK